MLARRVITETEDGVASVDYIKAEIARAPKRNWAGQFTPAQEVGFRDELWKKLADGGMNPDAIALACARAARSASHIRRRLRKLEKEDRRAQAEAG